MGSARTSSPRTRGRGQRASRGLGPARTCQSRPRKFPLVLLATAILAVAAVWTRAQPQAPSARANKPNHRFIALDVHIDSGDVPLAAYQFELTAETGSFKIVGLEGGEHAAFADPPYHDKKALSESQGRHDRVIVAAFDTGADLPTGNTRVARVHVRITGGPMPEFVVKLIVAASDDGETIEAVATCSQGK